MGFLSSIGGIFSNPLGTIGAIANPGLALGLGSLGAAGNALGLNQDPMAGYNAAQMEMFNKNIAEEEKFAQNDIQWKVADAAKAGISPLAAIGASETSFSPVTANIQPDQGTFGQQMGRSLLQDFASQGIKRALAVGSSSSDRALQETSLRTAKANADLAETQVKIANLRLSQMSAPPNPSIPDAIQSFRLPDGTIVNGPSADYAHSLNAQPFGRFQYGVQDAFHGSHDYENIPIIYTFPSGQQWNIKR